MKARAGVGTVYKEVDANRRTRWRAEKLVRLPDGTRRRVITRGRTATEAEDKLKAREKQLARAHPDALRLTLRDFLTDYLAELELTSAPATTAEARRILARVIESHGHLPLASIQPKHVKEAMRADLRAGRLSTADRVRRHLKQALTEAQRMRWLVENPAALVKTIRVPETKRVAWEKREAHDFLKEAKRLHGGYYAMFYTALLTGLRRGELIGLEWADVTTEGVRVRGSAGRFGRGPTKTPAGERFVPWAGDAYLTVAAARAELPDSPLAFPSLAGTPLGERNVNRAFAAVLDRLPTPEDDPEGGVRRMRLHDVRRTTATWWAMAGVPPKVIQYLLGHATPHLALAIYTDVMEGQAKQAALDPAEWLVGGTIGGNAGLSRDTKRYS